MNDTLENIPVYLIEPNPEQPRKTFDQEKLRALGESIVQHGLEQPITVERNGDGYILRDGERRWRAHQLMGLPTIQAKVVDPPARQEDKERLIGAFVANYHREPLNPVEEARVIQKMSNELGMNHGEIAQALSMSRSAVYNKMRLVDTLNNAALDALAGAIISERQAFALVPLFELPDSWHANNPLAARGLVDWVIRSDASSNQVRETVKNTIRGYSDSVANKIWFDVPFDMQAGIEQATCHGCPFLDAEQGICVEKTCFARKQEIFHEMVRFSSQVQALGLKQLDPDHPLWEIGSFYTFTPEDMPAILAGGCSGLRYRVIETTNGQYPVMINQWAALVCANGSFCSCQKKSLRANNNVEKLPAKRTFDIVIDPHVPDQPYRVALDGRCFWFQPTEVERIVELFCVQNGIDVDAVLPPKPFEGIPKL